MQNFVDLDIPNENSRGSRLLLAFTSLFSPQGYTMRWLQGRSIRETIRSHIENSDYDLIHLDTISLDFVRDLVPPATAVALDHHNIESHMMARRADRETGLLKSLYFRWEAQKLARAESSAIPEYTANIVCSEDDRQRLLELAPDASAEVIPNGIDITDSKPIRSVTELRLLFIGGLSWYPNAAAVRVLITEFADALRKQTASFHIDIIGKNPPEDIRATCEKHSDITLHGFVDDITPYYEKATAFVCPINDGGGTKLKVLDAMAHRVPVVAFELACEGIDVTHGENVLLSSNPSELAALVQRLHQDPLLGQKIGDQGRALVESRYDYRAIGDALSKYYQDRLSQH